MLAKAAQDPHSHQAWLFVLWKKWMNNGAALPARPALSWGGEKGEQTPCTLGYGLRS